MARDRNAKLPPRERLLAAADELFYREGVHSVGIDRVIERAGVAKATLYNAFGSKEELVKAYLDGRHEARKRRLAQAMDGIDSPRGKLLVVFDVMDKLFAAPGYQGCAFLNASAESPAGGLVDKVSEEYQIGRAYGRCSRALPPMLGHRSRGSWRINWCCCTTALP